ncbi:MAG: type II toxin-antitoxin system HicA family toxin [bacterium]|nr:type II toxin-antitoxin system HicA family toxin [bacterium]
MAKIPQLTSSQVEKLLIGKGFVFARQKGSHRIFMKEGLVIVIPFRRKPLKKGTLDAILKQAGLK